MIEIPDHIKDVEPLHRRIHPHFVKQDGTVSSQAFTDPEASVDRGRYRPAEESLLNYPSHGLAVIEAGFARSLGQDVIADPELLNRAHALIKGKKTRSVARKLAREAEWVRHVDVSAS